MTEAARPGLVRRVFGGFWRLLDGTRRVVMNLFFLLLLVLVGLGMFAGGGAAPPLKEKTALLLNFQGDVLEQKAVNPQQAALAQLQGLSTQHTLLRDVVAVLDAAAKDPKIAHVVLLPDEYGAMGLPQAREIGAALLRFKASGKKVYAWGSRYGQREYYLAAYADEVWMHPMGMVMVEGYGRLRNYYKDAMDKLGLGVNLIRVGTFKSFAEPYIANGPSDAAREADQTLYSQLWLTYQEGVEKARKLPAGHLSAYVEQALEKLQEADGQPGKMALNAKLVDALKTRDELRATLIEKGTLSADKKTFEQVSYQAYLALQKTDSGSGDAIGLVVAEGSIEDGESSPGTVGGLATSNLIRKAREDERIKALVLRVNSPGGSVFGSELIRREVELTRQAGKPVVVSMGNVAASGGYWIAMGADEVMADPATITGSIGVFALLPQADVAMDKLGVHADGVTTTWLGAAGDPRRPADPRFLALMQTSVNHIYKDFTTRAAQARKTTPEAIDVVAQGRVWTGSQAKAHGLIDTLGGYQEAIASAAARAKLDPDTRVQMIERNQGRVEQLLSMLGTEARAALGAAVVQALVPASTTAAMWQGLPAGTQAGVTADVQWLIRQFQTAGPAAQRPIMAHCLCSAP